MLNRDRSSRSELEKSAKGGIMRGACLCGDIEYEVSKFNGNIYQCHCSLCRKQGGSFSNSGAIVPAENLRWMKGQDRINIWVKDTGFTSSFCKGCGSPVPNLLRKLDYYWIPVGTLEDGDFNVVASIFLNSKASWATVSPESTQFDGMPDVNEFIDYLGKEWHG